MNKRKLVVGKQKISRRRFSHSAKATKKKKTGSRDRGHDSSTDENNDFLWLYNMNTEIGQEVGCRNTTKHLLSAMNQIADMKKSPTP